MSPDSTLLSHQLPSYSDDDALCFADDDSYNNNDIVEKNVRKRTLVEDSLAISTYGPAASGNSCCSQVVSAASPASLCRAGLQ